jgi:hypothetical protein
MCFIQWLCTSCPGLPPRLSSKSRGHKMKSTVGRTENSYCLISSHIEHYRFPHIGLLTLRFPGLRSRLQTRDQKRESYVAPEVFVPASPSPQWGKVSIVLPMGSRDIFIPVSEHASFCGWCPMTLPAGSQKLCGLSASQWPRLYFHSNSSSSC